MGFHPVSHLSHSTPHSRKLVKKDDREEDEGPGIKKDENHSDSESDAGRDRDADDVDVRDIRYKLENHVRNQNQFYTCGMCQILKVFQTSLF